MDELDEAILTAVMDGKARRFDQILGLVDLSHKTLRLHLYNLVEEGSGRRGGATASSGEGVSLSFRV